MAGNLIKIICVVSVLSLSSLAADAADGKFAIGPQGGYVFSDYSVKNAPFGENYDNDNGWMAGVFLEFGVWTVTLRPEVNYVQKGYTVANTAEVTQKYLEIPVLLKVNPFGGAAVSPFIVLGPSWSKHLQTDVKLLGTTTTYNDQADDWDISGVAGAGIEFNLSDNVGMNVQGRYNFGLRDLDKSTTEIKSRGIYAMAGLNFSF
jgi:opacity protein-like surface antigen